MKVRKRKRPSGPKNSRKNSVKGGSTEGFKEDQFFGSGPKKTRKTFYDDEEIEEDDDLDGVDKSEEEEEEEGRKEDAETADEKRVRVAKAYLEKIKAITRREEDQDVEELDEEKAEEERKGARDSLVTDFLLQEQLEESGRVRRQLASRVQRPGKHETFHALVKHRKPVTAVCLSEDVVTGFSASKDGAILHWDVETGKSEKYMWPSWDILSSHGARKAENPSIKWSSHVLALAVSSDGRYLATGGLDRHVHLWDIRTREHIQIREETHLIFRSSTASLESCCFINNDEFLSGSDDGSIELWNSLKKKPTFVLKNAHSISVPKCNSSAEDELKNTENGLKGRRHGHGLAPSQFAEVVIWPHLELATVWCVCGV